MTFISISLLLLEVSKMLKFNSYYPRGLRELKKNSQHYISSSGEDLEIYMEPSCQVVIISPTDITAAAVQ